MENSIQWKVEGADRVHEIPEEAVVMIRAGDRLVSFCIKDNEIHCAFNGPTEDIVMNLDRKRL